MGIYSFRGGVHPKGYKELTADKPLVEYLPKGELVFPLSQHLGKPAIPVVKRNDLVKVGQLIAKADGFISANIHSSVSGKVKIIEHRPNNAGIMGESIVIINDGEYTPFEGVGEKTDYEQLTPREIIDKVKEAGIVGLGGAGFPTYVKLMPQKPEDIRWIVANGAECEPGITCDDRLMQENPEQIVEGLKIVLRIFPTAKAVIAIETNKPKAIESMRRAVGNDPRFEILELKVKYPQVFEYYKNLIQLRKNHPAFRLGNADLVRKHLQFIDAPEGTIAYRLKNYAGRDEWRNIIVILNASKSPAEVLIPEGNYTVVCCDGIINEQGLGSLKGNKVIVDPQSAIILHD